MNTFNISVFQMNNRKFRLQRMLENGNFVTVRKLQDSPVFENVPIGVYRIIVATPEKAIRNCPDGVTIQTFFGQEVGYLGQFATVSTNRVDLTDASNSNDNKFFFSDRDGHNMFGDGWFDSDESVFITHPGGNYTDYFFTMKELDGQKRWKGTGWVMGQKFPSELNLSDWWADTNPWVFDPFTRVEVSLVTSNPYYNCGQGSWNLRQKVFVVCPAGWGCRLASDGSVVESKILISPNPTSDVLRFTNMDIGMYDFDVYISDIAGKVVKQLSHLDQEFINLSDLDDGMYVLKIYKDGQYESTEKVVIAK